MSTATSPSAQPSLAWEKALTQSRTLQKAKKKNNPAMVAAVVCMVILAISGVWRSMHQVKPVQTIQVVTTKTDTAAGTRLGFMALSYLDVPREFVTDEMVTKLQDVDNHVTKMFVPAGEPLRKYMFFNTPQGLAQSLDTDERAITLKLDDDALVDHEIAADDLVDIIVVSTKDGEKYAKTVCQSARVAMAVSKEQANSRGQSANANKVTLAVAPDVAESVSEAAEVGKVRLVLRNRLSARHPSLSGSQPRDLLPSSAFRVDKETAAKIVQGDKSIATSLPPLPVPALPPPPMPELFASASQSKDSVEGALQWMVQVFSGSKKETVGVAKD
jgi:Flp pilus assembly protein CpaB